MCSYLVNVTKGRGVLMACTIFGMTLWPILKEAQGFALLPFHERVAVTRYNGANATSNLNGRHHLQRGGE